MHCKKLVSKSLSSLAVVFVSFVLTILSSGTTYALNHSGAITSSETWTLANSPHIVTGNVDVRNGATLTIEPGCQVKFDSGKVLYIGLYGAATLNATGTSANPITFTSNASTPAPGDWQGIVFLNSTNSASTIMDYCTVEYGGNGSYNSNIDCNSASPTIQNCTIRHSDGYGIYCDAGSAPTLTNNTISDNGSYPISEFCNTLDSNVTGNTGSGNGTDAIEVRGGTISSSHTWIPQGFYFNVTSEIDVRSDATLTINPGCLVKFNYGIGLYIGLNGGSALNAVGTRVDPITFTSNESSPAAGDWQGIFFGNLTNDGSTTVHYCTVEYGGNGDNNSNIYCASASPALQHCIIRNSDGYGIYTTGSAAQPSISCLAITNNDYGVYASDSANPTIGDCSITGNTTYGVYSDSSSITIDAENNWWGSADGPGGSGPGSGDAVSSYVDYTPWRTAFDSCLETIALSPASETNLVGSQHTVTAIVKDESAEPIEGVEVSFEIISGPHAGENGTDTTDSNGEATFTYTGTLEGTDTIVASFVDFFGRTISDGGVTETWEALATPTPTASPAPTLPPLPTPQVSPSPSVLPGSVFGIVQDEDENLLGGVTVIIVGNNFSDNTETNEDGFFTFENVLSGNYALTFEKEGYGTQTKEISLGEGEVKDLGTITLEQVETGKIYGYVVNIKGSPIEFVKLKLKSVKTKGVKTKVIKTATSDADGFFEFTDLDADTYVIFANKKGYKKTRQKVVLEESQSMEIEIVMKKIKRTPGRR